MGRGGMMTHKNMTDYERLKLNKNYVKHKEETGMDCFGQSHGDYQFCHICEQKNICKVVSEGNRENQREKYNAMTELFTPQQVNWLTAYINSIVAERMECAFDILQEQILAEAEGEEHEPVR